MEHKIIQRDIDSLIFAEYNPRQLTKDQHQHLKDSIQRFGLVDPILVNKHKDRKDIIIGGHQRVRVAKDLDIQEVPCIELSLPYERERELNVRLNANTGEWDTDVLANMFDIDELQDWGFDDINLDLLKEPELDELIGDDKDKPPKIMITFKTFEHQEDAIEDIKFILEKYEGSYYSLSGGEV